MRILTNGLTTGAAMAATLLTTQPAIAADTTTNAGVRLYFSLPFHKSERAPQRTAPRVGMQLFGSVDVEDQPLNLHLSDQMPLVDLGFTSEGLGKLDFMGSDVLESYNLSENKLDFIGTIATSMLTTGIILVAIPVGAAVYCDATECIDRFKNKADEEIRAEIASTISPPAK